MTDLRDIKRSRRGLWNGQPAPIDPDGTYAADPAPDGLDFLSRKQRYDTAIRTILGHQGGGLGITREAWEQRKRDAATQIKKLQKIVNAREGES